MGCSGQAISAGEAGDPGSENGNIFHAHLLALLQRELRTFRSGNIIRALLFISAKTFFLAVAAQNCNTRVLLAAEIQIIGMSSWPSADSDIFSSYQAKIRPDAQTTYLFFDQAQIELGFPGFHDTAIEGFGSVSVVPPPKARARAGSVSSSAKAWWKASRSSSTTKPFLPRRTKPKRPANKSSSRAKIRSTALTQPPVVQSKACT